MFDSEKKYFPIKVKPACQSKWTWSSLWLTEGTTSSCHRVRHLPIPLDDFDSFHNLPGKIEDREKMLRGEWPTGGCEYCRDIEAAGGSSDRMYHLKIPNLTPPELDTDPTATSVTPRIVEVFINNLCNLKCVYCYAACSTQIEQENNKFGDFKFKGVEINNGTLKDTKPYQAQYFEKFCQWLEKNSSTLVHLNLLGGETFYQPELDVILDVLSKGKNPNLEITIITNLMIKPARLKAYIDRFRQMCVDRNIGRLALTVSIDCWGAEQEYARTGLDLKTWEENFAHVVEQKWIRLHTNQTITSLTLRTVPELFEKINHYRKIRPISTEFSFVIGYPKLHPGIFGGEFWREDFDKILALMPEDTEYQRNSKVYMTGIQAQVLASEVNPTEIENLQIYLDELDRRRNTNWRAVFPYLDAQVQKILNTGN